MEIKNSNDHKKVADDNVVVTVESSVAGLGQFDVGAALFDKLTPSTVSFFFQYFNSMLSKYTLRHFLEQLLERRTLGQT